MNPIYIASWYTESGDRGVLGYFTEKPTDEQLEKLFREAAPDEFDDTTYDEPCRYIDWTVEELSPIALPTTDFPNFDKAF